MAKKTGTEEASSGARRSTKENKFPSFTRCSRRSFPYVDGVLDRGKDSVMFMLALRRLRRYLFVFLRSKFSMSCFNAFRRALFALSVFYAI